MSETPEQKDAIRRAGAIIKCAFPGDNMQICFNLARNHSNVNYNIKKSGILKPEKQETK